MGDCPTARPTPASPTMPDAAAPALALATAAAREAGALARAAFHRPLQITSKGGSDIVTQVDHAAEALICAQIAAAFPDDAILAEERGEQVGSSPYCWVIDPLDGTHNFATGLPFWCVSIARYDTRVNRPQIGVVYDALHDELFAARHGSGATLDGLPIRVGRVSDLAEAVVACDIGYNPAISRQMMRAATLVQPRTRRVRLLGSAVLALAYVAAGRLDAFFHLQLQPWDIAAAWLLVEEAGGLLTGWTGAPAALAQPHVVAANPTLHPALLRLLAEEMGDAE